MRASWFSAYDAAGLSLRTNMLAFPDSITFSWEAAQQCDALDSSNPPHLNPELLQQSAPSPRRSQINSRRRIR
jgi:hypothetical protein